MVKFYYTFQSVEVEEVCCVDLEAVFDVALLCYCP